MTKRILTAAFLVFTAFSITSCSDDDDRPLNVDTSTATSVLGTGIWRITNFEDDGVNKTTDFEGFTFTFSNGNVLAVNGNEQSFSGSWSVVADDDYDTPPDTNLDLNIYFGNPFTFRQLNDDWDIMSISETRVEVADIDDDGPSDYLVFEKN